MATLQGDGLGPITFFEVSNGGSPSYTLNNGNSRVERTYRVAWGDRIPFVKLALGYSKIGQIGGFANRGSSATLPFTTQVLRFLPLACQDFQAPNAGQGGFAGGLLGGGGAGQVPPGDGNLWLWATAVTKMVGEGPLGVLGPAGDGADQAPPAFKFCMVTLQFEALSYRVISDTDTPKVTFQGFFQTGVSDPFSGILTDPLNNVPSILDESQRTRYVTRSRKPSVEYLALNRGSRHWVDVPKTSVDYASAIVQPSVEVIWTWHQVPFIPQAAMTYLGKVNQFTLTENDLPGQPVVYLPGTLLLVGADIRPYRMGSGAYVQDIVYRMKYFDPENNGRGHNFFYRYVSRSMLAGQGLAAFQGGAGGGVLAVAGPGYVVRLKMTDSGQNDSHTIVMDPALVIPDPNNPLNLVSLDPYLNGVAPGSGQPIYKYADFRYLFTLYAKTPPNN